MIFGTWSSLIVINVCAWMPAYSSYYPAVLFLLFYSQSKPAATSTSVALTDYISVGYLCNMKLKKRVISNSESQGEANEINSDVIYPHFSW